MSMQKDFGYSDVTPGNNQTQGLITHHFTNADNRFSVISKVYNFYNSQQ